MLRHSPGPSWGRFWTQNLTFQSTELHRLKVATAFLFFLHVAEKIITKENQHFAYYHRPKSTHKVTAFDLFQIRLYLSGIVSALLHVYTRHTADFSRLSIISAG